MIEEKNVSLEIAKLLKENNFKEWCNYCYGTDVRHNNISIDEDTEFELKCEGKENEIEYVDGGVLHYFWYRNNEDDKLYAAPTHTVVSSWLRTKKLYLDTITMWNSLGIVTHYETNLYDGNHFHKYLTIGKGTTVEDSLENAFKFCFQHMNDLLPKISN